MEFIRNIDITILHFIQEFLRNPIMDKIFVFITRLGDDGLIWLSLAVILLFFKKTRKCGVMIIVTVSLTFLVGDKIIKHLFSRNRPFLLYPLPPPAKLLIKAPTGYSFPSGHTASSFSAATAIFFYNKRFGTAAFCMAALIAFSRLYLYVHYPSDILGGIILGIGMCFLTKFLLDYFYKKVKTNGRV